MVAMAYRTTPHPATGNTPAFLVMGVDPRLPVDCELESEASVSPEDTDGRLEELARWREAVRASGYKLSTNHPPCYNESSPGCW